MGEKIEVGVAFLRFDLWAQSFDLDIKIKIAGATVALIDVTQESETSEAALLSSKCNLNNVQRQVLHVPPVHAHQYVTLIDDGVEVAGLELLVAVGVLCNNVSSHSMWAFQHDVHSNRAPSHGPHAYLRVLIFMQVPFKRLALFPQPM